MQGFRARNAQNLPTGFVTILTVLTALAGLAANAAAQCQVDKLTAIDGGGER